MMHLVTNTTAHTTDSADIENLLAELVAAAELSEMAALNRQADNTVAYAAVAVLEKARDVQAALMGGRRAA